jgi:hypothetical protein
MAQLMRLIILFIIPAGNTRGRHKTVNNYTTTVFNKFPMPLRGRMTYVLLRSTVFLNIAMSGRGNLQSDHHEQLSFARPSKA